MIILNALSQTVHFYIIYNSSSSADFTGNDAGYFIAYLLSIFECYKNESISDRHEVNNNCSYHFTLCLSFLSSSFFVVLHFCLLFSLSSLSAVRFISFDRSVLGSFLPDFWLLLVLREKKNICAVVPAALQHGMIFKWCFSFLSRFLAAICVFMMWSRATSPAGLSPSARLL